MRVNCRVDLVYLVSCFSLGCLNWCEIERLIWGGDRLHHRGRCQNTLFKTITCLQWKVVYAHCSIESSLYVWNLGLIGTSFCFFQPVLKKERLGSCVPLWGSTSCYKSSTADLSQGHVFSQSALFQMVAKQPAEEHIILLLHILHLLYCLLPSRGVQWT